MSLTNATADAAATTLCTTLGITDAASIGVYKDLFRQIWAGIKADLVVTIAPASIVTTGSATTQSGPTAPVLPVIS